MVLNMTVTVWCCPGTRYRRRGVDPLGNVANFVETEMVRNSHTAPVLCTHLLCDPDPAGRVTPRLLCSSERVCSRVLDPTRDQVPSTSYH